MPVPGARYRDVRSGFRGLTGFSALANRFWDGLTHLGWVGDVWLRGRPHTLGAWRTPCWRRRLGPAADFLTWIANNFDPSVTWSDLDWIRAEWDRPIVIKGVLDPQDARDSVKAGAQGIVVSNHGGRQLDGVRSSISALPRIVEAVGGDLEVFLDGGVRSGLDVLKALALGAKACFIGRPWAYALGAGGGTAVTKLLGTMRAELEVAMVLTGCDSLSKAGRELIDRRSDPRSIDGAPRRHPGLEFRIFEAVGAVIDARHELQFRTREPADGYASDIGTRLPRAEELPQLVQRGAPYRSCTPRAAKSSTPRSARPSAFQVFA